MSGSAQVGLRVLEHSADPSAIAAPYAGWLLARMGARVTRLIAAVDDRHDAHDRSSPNPLRLAAEALSRGKATQALPSNHDEFVALLATNDILLCDAPHALEALTGPIASLGRRAPRAIIGVVTPFGLEGPYAGLPGTALDAQALGAVAWSLGEPDRAPLTLPPGVTEHQGGAMLAAGCLLALTVRDARGSGRVVDISLSDVLASYVAGNSRFYVHHGLQWQRSGRRASGSGGAYPYMILPCKDGTVCVCGRTRDEWNRLVGAMGNPAWATQPRYQDLRAMGKQYPDEVDALVAPWFAARSKAELAALAVEHNLIVAPLRDCAEVLATEHFTERGFFEPDRIGGHDVRAPGLPFHVIEERSERAPNIVSELLSGGCVPAKTAGETPSQPLAGMRVLDFGWVWSAPWVSTMLAELGAQVIKVEHGLRPDNLRLSGRIFRDGKPVEGPSKEMSPMYHQINHGKLGITLNTKAPRAVELLKRLAAMSDCVIENMSPGAMDRTGLGFEVLRSVNPRLVMLSMSATGQFGALSSMRAYAPTMSAFVGLDALVGYRGEAPIGALNFGLGDPNASVHGLGVLLAALRRASATGKGCYIDLSQIEALGNTLRPYLLDAQVRGAQPAPMGNAHPEMAPHGIYPALGNDTWLTIAVADDTQWAALGELVPDQAWMRDPRFDTPAGRHAHAIALDMSLARWTALHQRDELVARLRRAGVASSPVLTVEAQRHDPNFAARGISSRVSIPIYGDETLYRAPWRFSDLTPRIDRCGPTTGEHNDYVFGELLGLAAGEIAGLKASGVVA